ncbi:MAG: helix-turn-helix transcriptional regulator [Chloroflexota bacterium]
MEKKHTLSDWLTTHMQINNLGTRETARRAGISHPLISDILNGGKPSLETCSVLAELFNTPPEEVLRMAGLLPPKAENDVIQERADYLMQRLSLAKQQQAVEFLEFLLTKEEKGEQRDRPPRRHAESEAN